MKTFRLLLMSLMSSLLFIPLLQAEFNSEPPVWSYDAGPLLNSSDTKIKAMAEELVELNANVPYYPAISYSLMDEQKFRPAFGPISWRMLLEPNSVKILFIGQDGTHIAEAAGRPATAGFGGRSHDLANHFGVDYSAAFINTYAFTIKGQYGDRGVPYLKNGRLNFTSQYLDNELWLMSQDPNSPIVQWRNNLIDWIIRNNQESLRMIVTFGGSARDSISSYVESKENGRVGTQLSWEALSGIRMPEYKLQYAGGNNLFPVPIDLQGQDIYEELFGKKPNYRPPYEGKGEPDNQQEVQDLLRENIEQYQNKMVFTRGGVKGSGLLHPAQLGGYDISQIYVDGRRTISLKGLKLNDGSTIKNNVLVVDLPHPTYLTNVARNQGYDKVAELVKWKSSDLEYWRDNYGWEIEPDHGQESIFFRGGGDYRYGRGEIGPEYYDFGTPENRMVSISDAKRIDPESILLGSREDTYLSEWGDGYSVINAMKKDLFAEEIDPTEMFISISRSDKSRADFDPGPGVELAKIMKTSLYGPNYSNLDRIKEANVTISDIEKVGDFAHYRGRPDNAKILILADPHGYDGIITSRALTGTRGQYLQGLIRFGISEDDWSESHFILKTVPFGMDGAPNRPGATHEQWVELLSLTQDYREQVIKYILDASDPVLILTDGVWAQKEMDIIFSRLKDDPQYKNEVERIGNRVVNMTRSGDDAKDMIQALKQIDSMGIATQSESFKGQRANIPSSHLSYYARVWEGTSKDRVITSRTMPGVAFAEVVPNWVVSQRPRMTKDSQQKVEILLETLYRNCLPKPGEKPYQFFKRKASGDMPVDCNN